MMWTAPASLLPRRPRPSEPSGTPLGPTPGPPDTPYCRNLQRRRAAKRSRASAGMGLDGVEYRNFLIFNLLKFIKNNQPEKNCGSNFFLSSLSAGNCHVTYISAVTFAILKHSAYFMCQALPLPLMCRNSLVMSFPSPLEELYFFHTNFDEDDFLYKNYMSTRCTTL